MTKDAFPVVEICDDRKRIKRLTIDYRFADITIPSDSSTDIPWEYQEHVVIDRESETLEDVVQRADRYNIVKKYHIAEGVKNFLDSLDAEDLFTEFYERDNDVPFLCGGIAVYEVKVEFYRQMSRVISGIYDKQGLPLDWSDFIKKLRAFVVRYDFGKMFDERVYTRTRRQKNQYIYLSVKFGDYGKPYYYLTDDDTIRVGEQVEVPVGSNGTERIVRVHKKEYFSEDDLPMPLDKVKSIIGRFVPPQENENGEVVIYCPMCDKTIATYICDDILYDLGDEIPGIITREDMEARRDICERCKYHDN